MDVIDLSLAVLNPSLGLTWAQTDVDEVYQEDVKRK
jgi:hypothetical protein